MTEPARLIHIIGGGTIQVVRPHLALCAPAWGGTARRLARAIESWPDALFAGARAILHLTAMAGGSPALATNEDVAALLDELLRDPHTCALLMPVALCDYRGAILEAAAGGGERPTASGEDQPRLRTSERGRRMILTPADKLIGRVRAARGDVVLAGFKTTAGASETEQIAAARSLLRAARADLVLANDLHTRENVLIRPDGEAHAAGTDRAGCLRALLESTGALIRARSRPADSSGIDAPSRTP